MSLLSYNFLCLRVALKMTASKVFFLYLRHYIKLLPPKRFKNMLKYILIQQYIFSGSPLLDTGAISFLLLSSLFVFTYSLAFFCFFFVCVFCVAVCTRLFTKSSINDLSKVALSF